jgi:hypothetical protein
VPPERDRRFFAPIKTDFILAKSPRHAPMPNNAAMAGNPAPQQEETMLTPAITLLFSGVWLTYLAIIAARTAPVLRALTQRSVRRR